MRKWLLLVVYLCPVVAFADVTVYPECDYGGRGVSLAPGDYSARELKEFGVPDNSISSIDVDRGYAITVYEHDMWIGRNGSLRRADPCLANDRFDNVITSLTVRAALDAEELPNLAAPAAPGSSDAITLYSECNYSGKSVSLAAGEYNLADLKKFGMDNNSVSSLKVPAGFTVTLYENDFLRGRAGRLQADDDCLKNDRFDNLLSSVAVRGAPDAPPSIGSRDNTGNVSVTLYSDCDYGGTSVKLTAGEYNATQLQELGFANNTVSSIQVGEGWQIELFENDFFRGTSGTLRQNDSCLIDDRFNDRISSVIVSQDSRAPEEPRTQEVAVTVFEYCSHKGGSAKLTPGHYDKAALASAGISENIISSLKVEDGFEVTLYDDPSFGGEGKKFTGIEDCLDDDGLNNAVSSLVIEPEKTQAGGALAELLPTAAEKNPLDFESIDQALACVKQYVDRDICDSQRWRDMTTRCELEGKDLMTDGYLRGHIEAGNCKQQYWSELARRVANPRLR